MNIQSIVSNLHQISNTTKWVVGGVVGLGSLAAIGLIVRRVLADSPHANTGQPGTTEGTSPNTTAGMPPQIENTHSNTEQPPASENGPPPSQTANPSLEANESSTPGIAVNNEATPLSQEGDPNQGSARDLSPSPQLAEQPRPIPRCRTDIGDEGLLSYVQYHRDLDRLNIAGCEEITDQGLQNAAPYCKRLTSLNLKGCDQINGDGVKAIAEQCTDTLTHLDLSMCTGITDQGFQSAAPYFQKLTHLHLKHTKITDKAVRAIAQQCANTLTHLDLSGCKKISAELLGTIPQLFPNLTSLRLGNCRQVTDDALTAIAQHCPELTSLNLYGCFEITDKGLTAVAENCSKLVNLNLGWCTKISDSGVGKIIVNLSHLDDLNLSGCNITHHVLESIVDTSHLLTRLNVRECSKITSAELLAFVQEQHTKQLAYLRCDKLSDAEATAMRAANPSLEIVQD